MPLTDIAFQRCISSTCGETFGTEQVLVACTKCGDLLDIDYDWEKVRLPKRLAEFEQRWSELNFAFLFSCVLLFHVFISFALF